MKLVSIIGARPQFIKAAAVSQAILREPGIEEFVVHTGQHYDASMSDIFFHELKIPQPAAMLDISGGTHGAMTGRMLIALDELLLCEKPDFVLVYGDTNSTLAGALSAAKLNIPVAHVEAGLRSFNMRMPEEVNRILTDQVSRMLFCPTATAIENLRREGFEQREVTIIQTGDVMLDATLAFRPHAQRPANAPDGDFILATIHRAENTDDADRLQQIVTGLNDVHAHVCEVIVPMHPRTAKALQSAGIEPAFKVIPPVGYLEMLWLIAGSSAVATDSGGLQKEAYFLGKPCITLRDETEWVELVLQGTNQLVGANAKLIVKAVAAVAGSAFDPDLTIYGGGDCADRIVDALMSPGL